MKVILLKDVAKLGRRFEEVDVPSGHALNRLIPRKEAMPATKENLKRVVAMKSRTAADTEAVDAAVAAAVEALKDTPVTISATANEQGHLFEAIKGEQIVQAVAAAGHTIATTDIIMAEPIKEVGDHTVTIDHGDIKGTITVSVTAA